MALPAALEEARRQAVEDFLQSEDFKDRLVAKCKEGMRDMKASFNLTNPTVTRVDWSFISKISRETRRVK